MKRQTTLAELSRAIVASFCIAAVSIPQSALACVGSAGPVCGINPAACLKSMVLTKSVPGPIFPIPPAGMGMLIVSANLFITCPATNNCGTACPSVAVPVSASLTMTLVPPPPPACPVTSPALAATISTAGGTMGMPVCTAAGTFNPYAVAVGIPGGTCPGLYTVVGTATVTFSDGMVLTQTGDTVVCLVDPAPGMPSVPRLSVELITPSFPRMAPGDQHVASYRIINNDPSNSVTLTAFATSQQGAVRPQGGHEAQGVFAISNPFGDDFPILFNPGANCIPLPSHPYTQPTISLPLPILPPRGTNIVRVGIRSYGQCASGSCSESTLRVQGTFADGSPALGCSGMALSADTSIPSQTCARQVNDCNANGIPDALDISSRRSQDQNFNALPDECEEILIVPFYSSVTPITPQPGAPIQVQVAFNEALPIQSVWANGSPLVRTQLFGSPLWVGTIPADTRPGPQTVYFLGKDSAGGLASSIAPYTVVAPQTRLLAEGGPWKYLADGSDQGIAWRAPGFNDSGWSNGTARLGFGGDGEATTIASAASNFVTFYFRQSFTVASAAAFTNLFGQIQVDDGVILYLNGTEIYRRNMTNDAGNLNYRSLASFTVANTNEQTFWTFFTNSLALVNGVNVLAAEVHQSATNSSDLGFNLDLVGNYSGALPPVITVTSPTTTAPYNAAGLPLLVNARDPEGTVTNVDFYVDGTFASRTTNAPFSGLWLTPVLGAHTVHAVATDNTGLTAMSQTQPFTVVPPSVLTTLVNSNSTWRYLDDGSNQGELWRTNTYNDAGWSNGVAELGYGDGPAVPEATVIRNTGTNGQRTITTYFRKNFNVAEPGYYSNLVVRLRRDDGGVVYLNGVEIFRSNMTNAPGIPVLFTDLALLAADEVSFFSGPVSASLLRSGDNLVAVEIHQNTAASSDVSFDLQLQAQSGPLLFISQAGGMGTLNWLPVVPGLELQSAPTPSGPWSPAPNQANPQSFTVSPLDPPVFWRLLAP